MAIRPRHTLALALAVSLLSACQLPSPNPMRPPSFKLEALAAASRAVLPTGAVTVRDPATGQPISPAHAGQLTVRFEHLLARAGRQLLATAADVDHLTIKLSGNGVDHSEPISHAMLLAGQTSFTFSGLPAGTLTVTITAFNAANAVIGLDVKQASVTAGQTTVLASSVLLTPTVPAPRVIVGSSGGGSGGATSGTLTVGVSFVDNKPVLTPPIRGIYAPPGEMNMGYWQVTLDATGNAWFTGSHSFADAVTRTGAIGHVTPADVLTLIPVPGTTPMALATSPDRSRIFMSEPASDTSGVAATLSLTSAGTVDRSAPLGAYASRAIAVAPDGTVYLVPDPYGEMFSVNNKISPAGAPSFANGLPYNSSKIETVACDSLGHAVALLRGSSDLNDDWGARVRGLAADGTQLFERSYDLATFGYQLGAQNALAIDAQDAIWVPIPARRVIEKLSPSGALLATYPVVVPCDSVHIDDAGRIWAYASQGGGEKDFVVRLSASGEVQAYYYIGENLTKGDLAISADDHMWVIVPDKGLIHLKLDPLGP